MKPATTHRRAQVATASATLAAKRKADGMTRVTVWLTGPAAAKLEGLSKEHGTKDRAVVHAILQLRE